jgi:hypothetical protein
VKTKILTGVAVLVFGVLLLPRLARRIDSTLGPVLERAAAMEAQYRDMTNAYPIAARDIEANERSAT